MPSIHSLIREQKADLGRKIALRELSGYDEAPEPTNGQQTPPKRELEVFRAVESPAVSTAPPQPPRKAWDELAYERLRWAVSNGVIRVTLLKIIGVYPFVRSFVKAVLSPKVDSPTYLERMGICQGCNRQVIGKRHKKYCGACGCGQWFLARLDIKNRMSGWNCPLGKHPGSVALRHNDPRRREV